MRLFGANAPVINVLYLDKTKERAQRNSVTHCSVVHRPLLAQIYWRQNWSPCPNSPLIDRSVRVAKTQKHKTTKTTAKPLERS